MNEGLRSANEAEAIGSLSQLSQENGGLVQGVRYTAETRLREAHELEYAITILNTERVNNPSRAPRLGRWRATSYILNQYLAPNAIATRGEVFFRAR